MTPDGKETSLFVECGGEVVDEGIWMLPIDGMGYREAIDGELASQFRVEIDPATLLRDEQADFWIWNGRVVHEDHKYSGMAVEVSLWKQSLSAESVTLSVLDGDELAYSGQALTCGLEKPV